MADFRSVAEFLKNKPYAADVKLGIICGSGLSSLSSTMTSTYTIPFTSIPSFPPSTVPGHVGEIVFGLLNGVVTVCLRGRFHSYEGYAMNTCALPVRVMRCLGVKIVIVTNAAGGLKEDCNVGDVLCINDHFALPNMTGNNCLIGPNDDELGPRFPPMSNAYDVTLQNIFAEASTSLNYDSFTRKNNTYCFVSGPTYESPSESLFLRNLGGSCVGMSTIPEVVAAHHCGIKVLCISLITNKVVMPGDMNKGKDANHEEVLAAVDNRGEQVRNLVTEIVGRCKTYLDELPELSVIDLNSKKKAEIKTKNSGGKCWVKNDGIGVGTSWKHGQFVGVVLAAVGIGFVLGGRRRR